MLQFFVYISSVIWLTHYYRLSRTFGNTYATSLTLISRYLNCTPVIQIGHVARARAKQGWLARRVGYGTVEVDLKLPRTDRLLIRGVVDPVPLAKAINDSLASFSGDASE